MNYQYFFKIKISENKLFKFIVLGMLLYVQIKITIFNTRDNIFSGDTLIIRAPRSLRVEVLLSEANLDKEYTAGHLKLQCVTF